MQEKLITGISGVVGGFPENEYIPFVESFSKYEFKNIDTQVAINKILSKAKNIRQHKELVW